MKATVNYEGGTLLADLTKPIDISIPLTNSENNPIAWYLDKPVIEPVKMGNWIGKVSEGSSTNFNNVLFNPHGHSTHTECLGHITRNFYSINQALKQFFFTAELISITPIKSDNDFVIAESQVSAALSGKKPDAIIVRTLPNEAGKKSTNYSNTNPPYLEEAAARFIRDCGIKHLLIDLPSIDREQDEGRLAAHKAFWNVKDITNLNDDALHDATITEMIYVDDTIKDGCYLLNLQIASFENDASPSKPVLYKLSEQ